MLALTSLKWGVALAVILLTLSITVPGAFLVLPHTSGSGYLLLAFNHVVTWVLVSHVLFNFAASALCSAGTVREEFVVPREGEPIAQGAFDGVRRCHKCNWYKPGNAHHCGVCKTCVMEHDHHCPFINNCVGAKNLRNYLLFLMWVIAAMAFCMLQAGIIFVLQWDEVKASVVRAYNMGRGPFDIVFVHFFIFRALPWRLLTALHMTVSALGVGAGVGLLLFIQLRQISCLGQPRDASGGWAPPTTAAGKQQRLARVWAELQRIMGGGVLGWVAPRWGSPSPHSARTSARKNL